MIAMPGLSAMMFASLAALNPSLFTGSLDGASSSHKSLRVITFNLYNEHPERSARIRSAVEVLKELHPDVLLLQEVATGLLKPGDPVEEIREALGYRYAARYKLEEAVLFRNGLAVLSRYPIILSEGKRFSFNSWFEIKGAMSAEIDVPGRPVCFFNVHMAPEKGTQVKKRQFEELSRWIQDTAAGQDSVIGGDFNEDSSTPEFAKFIHDGRLDEIYSHLPDSAGMHTWTPDYRRPCLDPEHGEKLDSILIGPGAGGSRWVFNGGNVIDPAAVPHPSDHCPVMAEIERAAGD